MIDNYKKNYYEKFIKFTFGEKITLEETQKITLKCFKSKNIRINFFCIV